jgi:hypothetical protein
MKLLSLVVLALEVASCQADIGCISRGWLRCRGGSSPQPPNYDNPSYESHPAPELPPDLPYQDDKPRSSYQGEQHLTPPDLPSYEDGNNLSPYRSDQHPHMNHQQPPMYQQPPPLPPGYGDSRGQMIPSPPGYQGETIFQEPKFNEEPETMEPWDEPTTNENGTDLSSFNKEYILKGLARLYKKKILPLELSSRYGHFHSPPLSPADFVAPPMVLLLGQYRYARNEIYIL